MRESQGEPLALPALPQALAHQKYRSDIAPILRHPNSFQPNSSTIGVHDYFSLNAMAHNSLYSGLHQLYKVGVPKHNKPLRLAPLCIDAKKTQKPVVKLNQLGMVRAHDRQHNKFVGDTDDVGSLMGEEDDSNPYTPKYENDPTVAKKASQVNQTLMELDRTNEDLKVTANNMANKANELSLIKAKARSGLLKGLRDGDLEKIAASMEEDLLTQESQLNKMMTHAKGTKDAELTKELEEQQDALKAKMNSLQQIKDKAREELLRASKDGTLEKIASEYQEGDTNKDKEAEPISNVEQELGHLADDVERIVRDGAKTANKLECSTKKGRDALLAAKRKGELEDIYNRMHTTSEHLHIMSAELGQMQTKTKQDLLLAHRPDLLFNVYVGLGVVAKKYSDAIGKISFDTFNDANEDVDAKSGQLSHTVKELDKIIRRLHEIHIRIENNAPEFKENEKLLKPATVREQSVALVQVGDLIKTKTIDMNTTKEKARNCMLQGLRKGELEAIKNEADKLAEKKKELKQKLAHGLLQAVKEGNFEKIREDYIEKLKQAHDQNGDKVIAEKEKLFREDLQNITSNTIALWLRDRRKQLRNKDHVGSKIKTPLDEDVVKMEIRVLIEILEERAKAQ